MPMPNQRALPDNKHPVGTRCITLTIPDDDEWERQAFSELSRLAIWNLWKFDADHNGTVVAKQWRKALRSWRHCKSVIQVSGGADGGDENMIRQNPDNPCELQTSINGTDWCTFADLSLCLPKNSQPGTGSPQPTPGGGCQEYFAQIFASARYLVPTPVSSGDTIEVTGIIGAWNDGAYPDWRCPDGDLFFAGVCVTDTESLVGTDPVPTSPHMRLIVYLNGTPFALPDGPFTVPGGYSNAVAEIAVNDSDLTDNSGSAQANVKVCNNQATNWSHTFDFALSNGGWVVDLALESFASGGGVWTPGVGWQANLSPSTGAPNQRTAITIKLPISGLQYKTFDVTYDVTVGETSGGGGSLFTQDGSIGTLVDGSNLHLAYSGTFTTTDLYMIGVCAHAVGAPPSPAGALTLKTLTITGVGVEPTWP